MYIVIQILPVVTDLFSVRISQVQFPQKEDCLSSAWKQAMQYSDKTILIEST